MTEGAASTCATRAFNEKSSIEFEERGGATRLKIERALWRVGCSCDGT